MKNLLSIAVLLLPTMAVLGQDQRSPIKVPQVLNRGLGTPITPYTDRPPDVTLVPHGADARHGHIWVQNVGNGLLIAGEVDGGPPDFPRNKNLILERDHVEIWLADAKDPELPPVGWNEFQEKLTLPNGADSCAEWVKKSIARTSRPWRKSVDVGWTCRVTTAHISSGFFFGSIWSHRTMQSNPLPRARTTRSLLTLLATSRATRKSQPYLSLIVICRCGPVPAKMVSAIRLRS